MAQHTKDTIRRGFMELLKQRPFDNISVVDIARSCGINRNTFYYYYEDIFALVEDVLQSESRKIREEFSDCTDWESLFTASMAFVQHNKRAVTHLANSANRDRLELYLYRSTLENVSAVVRRQAVGLSVSEKDIESISLFYTATLVGLKTAWVLGGMKESSADHIRDTTALFRDNLRITLERAGRRI